MTVDELSEYGLVRMDAGEIRGFLSSHSVGVLGLPTEDAPSMRPMSFWFDGESRLYLLYVLGSSSRKEALSDRTDVARFLVYSAETMFNWRSVLLTGTLSEVPESEREAVQDAMDILWRPDLFEKASSSLNTKLYRFEIEEQTGIKHIGLPPAFEEKLSEGRPD
jgi:nitroimidazol reductase NimA-like FMN-containing flavoprotein (pyridoxamine 5'-phosphate oxidase superfamily)